MLWLLSIVFSIIGFFVLLGVFVSKFFSGLTLSPSATAGTLELPQEDYRHNEYFGDELVTRSSITTRSMCDSLSLDN